MKKFLAIILASLFILISLISCGKKQDLPDDEKTEAPTEESSVETDDICGSQMSTYTHYFYFVH